MRRKGRLPATATCTDGKKRLLTTPSHTGKGIGKELMLHLIEECRRYGLHALIACITEGNEASYALHEKLGFEKVSYFREVGRKFGKWLGIVDYELIL